MRRTLGIITVIAAGLLFTQGASAQEAATGRVSVTVIPGGATIFTESDTAPDFATYTLGGAVTVNVHRFVGIEGEIAGSFGIDQTLELADGTREAQPPHSATYSGSVLVYPAGNDRPFAPYVAGGVGGLTLFEEATVGVNQSETFVTGLVGGGVIYAVNDRLGIRGDYRFLATPSQDDAPAFFGRETRYGHRVYGGLTLRLVR